MEEIFRKIEETIKLLYQNEEKNGMKAVEYLLQEFQKMLANSPSERKEEEIIFGISLVRELLEAYENHDIMSMADCLEEKAVFFVKSCFGAK